MKKYIFRILTYSLLIIFYFLLLTPGLVSAEQISLGLYPPVIIIDAKPGETIEKSLVVENFSDNSQTLTATFQQFTASDQKNGSVTYQKNTQEFEKFLKNVSLSLDNQPLQRITLPAKQKKQLKLSIALPDDTRLNDYNFSVLFITDAQAPEPNNNPVTTSLIKGGIGANVLLSISGNETRQATIEKFSSPGFLEHGPVPFSILIKNPGAHRITPSGTILIKNMFGQLVGKVILSPMQVLANSDRYFSQTTNQFIYWNEPILLGLYEATLQISLPGNDTKYIKTAHFSIFPYKTILLSIFAIMIILAVRRRIHRYLSTQ